MVYESILLERLIPEGAALVKSLREKYIAVAAAYWLYTSEYDRWRLHLIVPDLGDKIFETYRSVVRAARGLRQAATDREGEYKSFLLESDDVVVEDLSDPIARAVNSYLQKHGSNLPTVAHRTYIEGEHVDNMYIYRTDMRFQ